VTELPSGTVTFVFTDVEGSTRLWEQHPDAMRGALARHDEVVRGAIEAHGGYVVKTTGDGFHAAFSAADAGVSAAVAVQRALDGEVWALPEPLRVRIGVHTGVASRRDGDYFGSSLNRAARLMAIAHGGQVVCSQATTDLARDALAEGVNFVDLGEHRLRDLSRAERVFQVFSAGLRREFPALDSLDVFPGNLPLQVTSFIGREREIGQTSTALTDGRVVTLTGVGGVGKTRLALQVAAEVLPRFREGAWLIELAPVRDPDGVVDAFTTLFGVGARAGQATTEALVEFLGTKQMLLVVDNCEHVLDPVADLIDSVTHACSGVVILATSREVLSVPGEHIIGVPSLSSPPADADVDAAGAAAAVALFVDRARAAHAPFELSAENARSVVQVCRRLDGIPLAIELAAARVHVMSPAELAAALDHRFDLLSGGRRGAVKRQQTLRATIDWSYDLLSEAQQVLLARLAVFAGGGTRDAVEAVCGGEPIVPRSVFALLTELVDRSLVVPEQGGPDTRYRLLETIREYAEERLVERSETKSLRDRHAAFYVEFHYALRNALGPDEWDAHRRIAAEAENLNLAMAWAVDQADIDVALAFLSYGWSAHRFSVDVLAQEAARDHPLYPEGLATAAVYAALHGDVEGTQRLCEEAQAAAGRLGDPHHSVEFGVANVLAIAWFTVGAFHESLTHYERAARVGRTTGNRVWVALSLGSAALFAVMGGESETAVDLATEGLAAARELGSPGWIAQCELALAGAVAATDPTRARALLRETLAQNADIPYWHLAAAILVAGRVGDFDSALDLAPDTIRELHWIAERPQLAAIFNIVARGLVDRDDEAAAVLQGAARSLASTALPATDSGAATIADADRGGVGGMIVDLRRATTRRLRERLGDDRFHQLRDRGAHMDIDQAVAYALSRLDAVVTNAPE
jgi:predicted ATPase/class 3 adenylate cyclase